MTVRVYVRVRAQTPAHSAFFEGRLQHGRQLGHFSATWNRNPCLDGLAKVPAIVFGLEGALALVPEKAHMQPLGVATVAALFPPQWRVRIIDQPQPLTDEDILQADLVMVSAMHAQRADARVVLSRCRKLGRRTLIGGPWANIEPEILLTLADHVVAGEVDEAFAGIAADLEAGRAGAFTRSRRGPT